MLDEVLKIGIGTAFAVVQTLTLAVIVAAFKTYSDVRVLKRDMNQAFQKIRDMELHWRQDDV